LAKVESVSKEIAERLSRHLDGLVDLADIVEEWPEANRKLRLPALSIIAGDPDYQPFSPFYHDKETVQNHAAVVKYIVGQYNWEMKLELWCKSKEMRHDLTEQMHQAFHSQLSSGIGNINLVLEKYHGIYASYLYGGYRFGDSEEASQRKEWRVTFPVLANCFAVSTDKQYIITQEPELDFDITNEPQ